MARLSPDQIADIVLNRRQVCGLEIDSRIREASNRFSAKALFELLAHLDVAALDFETRLAALSRSFSGSGASVIRFATRPDSVGGSKENDAQASSVPSEHYLKLVFRDEQAGYYQFHVFPDFDAPYVIGYSRKRAGAVQHIRLELTDGEALQTFIESCRSNPHFLRVERSTAEEFRDAPSNAM